MDAAAAAAAMDAAVAKLLVVVFVVVAVAAMLAAASSDVEVAPVAVAVAVVATSLWKLDPLNVAVVLFLSLRSYDASFRDLAMQLANSISIKNSSKS